LLEKLLNDDIKESQNSQQRGAGEEVRRPLARNPA
jgi:hypothetical protein